ncbi:MAG: M1 family metallopeptidase [Actinomycetota bacterium]
MSDLHPYRLPRVAVPQRYDLRLEPDLDAAAFDGTVTIRCRVASETSVIVLNAAELEIDVATATVPGTGSAPVELTVSLDADAERATISAPTPFPPGEIDLHLTFRGVLNDQLRGFYRSTWTDGDGDTHVLATTQFESTNARRAFPCFDEPDLKAVFAVTMVVPAGLDTVSCESEISREVLADGRTEVRFADTMLMSTYLVAFVVGELEMTEPVDVDGVPLRVVHVPGKGDLTDFALDCGAFSLRWLSEYFDLPYPGNKVDLVAIPDFAFGAMENLGCVTFREALLLTDPDQATQAELGRIALVIAHELAHMWFGDLVTMEWWDGIWLKEAFATFMEMACVDAWKPEWRQWEQFTVDRAAALDTDALHSTRPIEFPVGSPDEAEAMYDILTYEKGASIVRMLEQYLTPERFRDGVRAYLARHQFGNTRNSDLWDAIEEASGEPVRSTMDTWILQGGHPVIEATAEERGLRLAQRTNLYLGGDDDDRRWSVPIVVRADGAEHRRLLVDRVELIRLDAPTAAVVNAGGHGFYRVDYAAELREHLLHDAAEQMSTVERFGLVDDTWSSVLSGHATAADFLAVVRAFAFEHDLPVWRALGTGLRGIGRLVAADDRDRFRAEVRELVRPALDICGLEVAEGESPLERQLRGLLVGLAGSLGHDAEIVELARDWQRADVSGAEVDPELAAAAVTVVAEHGDATTYDAYLHQHRTSTNPQQQLRYLYALASFPDRAELDRTLDLAVTEVRTQNAPFLLAGCLNHPEHGPAAWSTVRSRWDEITERLPSNTITRVVSGVRWLIDDETSADVAAFLAEHPVPQGQRTVDQHLEKLRVLTELRRRERPRLADALA